jgi:asparagine synthase (glutamine-hydrolysing)
MSGIAAVLHLDGSAVRQSEVERMANVLKPYGPDRQRILARGNAAFAFCLHQLTPEDLLERQPLLFANRFVMLFDGRIDNRTEVGEALGMAASESQSIPDSMIALRLFERWGERAFERIVGVFAIIIMDLQERRLICARDHMGLRVLHYYRSPERFAVATIPEALFALSWVPRNLNKDKVGDALVQRGLNGETTYYQDIYRVLPGFIVRVSDTTFSKHQFWNPENIADVRFKHDNDYVEAFQERLAAAVRAQLRSRRVPCASITGGLDSSSIAVVAADMLAANGGKLHTFTAVREVIKEELRGRYFDEMPKVLQIAKINPNIVAHFVSPSKGHLVEKIAEQVRIGGDPPSGVLNGCWGMDLFAAVRSAGHNVMLGGEMGNHTMSNNGHLLLAELLRTGRWWRLLVEIASSGYRWRYLFRHRTIAPFIPAPLFRRYKQWRRGGRPPWYDYSAIHPEFAARSGVVDRAAREYLPFDMPPPRDARLYLTRVSFNGYCETADWFARVRAHFGIDIRTPAFDRRVVEFCIGIPQDQYLRKGCDRWLIRRAMQGRLPDSVLANRKTGAQSADWFSILTRERSRIRTELTRLAKYPDVASIVDLQRLTAILDDWPDREPPDYDAQAYPFFWALPQALGAASFIEQATSPNYAQ